jgi:ferredoxin
MRRFRVRARVEFLPGILQFCSLCAIITLGLEDPGHCGIGIRPPSSLVGTLPRTFRPQSAMNDRERVARVWIEEGCIVCDACEETAPLVFHVTEDACEVRPEALDPSFVEGLSQQIKDAALECPVEVIKYDVKANGDDATSKDDA